MCCLIFHLILVWTWSPSGENIWSRLQAESWYLKPLHQLLYTNALCTFLVVAVVPLLLSWCIGMCCCRMQSGERPATVCFSVLSVQPNIWNLCKDLSAEDSGSKQPVHNQLDTRHHLRLTSPQKTFSHHALWSVYKNTATRWLWMFSYMRTAWFKEVMIFCQKIFNACVSSSLTDGLIEAWFILFQIGPLPLLNKYNMSFPHFTLAFRNCSNIAFASSETYMSLLYFINEIHDYWLRYVAATVPIVCYLQFDKDDVFSKRK